MGPKTPKQGVTPKSKSCYGKISKQLFKPVGGKKVSFGPERDLVLLEEKERELMERERKIMEREKLLMEMETAAAATPSVTPISRKTSISMKGKRKIPATPYPSTSRQQPKINSSTNAGNNSPKEDGQQKRRKIKRQSYTLFGSTKNVTSRPSNTLTAQLNYTLATVPAKMHALKSDAKMCFAARIFELEKLESNLLKRLETVSNLNLDSADDDLNDKKFEVIEEMQDKIVEVQNYRGTKEYELHLKRPGLRANHSGRYVCCPVCIKKRSSD